MSAYFMPDTVLSTLQVLTYLDPVTMLRAKHLYGIAVLWTWKLWPWEVR